MGCVWVLSPPRRDAHVILVLVTCLSCGIVASCSERFEPGARVGSAVDAGNCSGKRRGVDWGLSGTVRAVGDATLARSSWTRSGLGGIVGLRSGGVVTLQRNTVEDVWRETKSVSSTADCAEVAGEDSSEGTKKTGETLQGLASIAVLPGERHVGDTLFGKEERGDGSVDGKGDSEIYTESDTSSLPDGGGIGSGEGRGQGQIEGGQEGATGLALLPVPGDAPITPPGSQGAAGAAGAGGKKLWLTRVSPRYLTVKVLFFLFYSSLGAVMPYLPVYYHSLNIPDRQMGHLGAITPAMTFLVSPLWGALTDKTGRLKEILVFTFVASVLFRISLAARQSFTWIVSVITLTAIVNAPVRPLLDSSVLNLLEDKKEYGKQRLWGQWGFGVGSFLTGRLLTKLGYKVAFTLHAMFSLPTLLILFHFSPKKEGKKTPPKFREGLKLVAKDADVLVFFSMVFAIGLSSGVIENFAYKRLRELGGTGSVLGVSRLVSSLSGIPMFYFSGAITKHLSVVGVLACSMLSYIVRFLIYASIRNPWSGLPAEALRGVTFAAMWAASTFHAHQIAPQGLSTTMLGILNAVYGGIGQSLGSLIGGSLSMRFGTAKAFVLYASFDAMLLAGFFLFWGLHPNGSKRAHMKKLGLEAAANKAEPSKAVGAGEEGEGEGGRSPGPATKALGE